MGTKVKWDGEPITIDLLEKIGVGNEISIVRGDLPLIDPRALVPRHGILQQSRVTSNYYVALEHSGGSIYLTGNCIPETKWMVATRREEPVAPHPLKEPLSKVRVGDEICVSFESDKGTAVIVGKVRFHQDTLIVGPHNTAIRNAAGEPTKHLEATLWHKSEPRLGELRRGPNGAIVMYVGGEDANEGRGWVGVDPNGDQDGNMFTMSTFQVKDWERVEVTKSE